MGRAGTWLLVAVLACGCNVDDTEFVGVARGEYVWVRSLSAMLPLGVVSAPGGVVVTGQLLSTADLGGEPLVSAGRSDLAIASFAADRGDHLYSVRYGSATEDEYAFVESVDATGTAFVHGPSFGATDLGQGIVPTHGGGSTDGYVGRYSAGAAVWIHRLAGPTPENLLTTALGTGSRLYAAGWFETSTDLAGMPLNSAGGRDAILARIHKLTGAVEVVKTYGGAGREEISSVGTHGEDVFVAGTFDGTLALGAGVEPLTSSGGLDGFVARLSADGVPVWAVPLGGAGDDRDLRIVIDGGGDLYVAGTFTTTLALGPTTLTSTGMADHFVARLRGGDGSVVWATSFGSPGNEQSGRLAVDDDGNVAFAATLQGPLPGSASEGGADAMIAELAAASGQLVWQHVYSTPGDDRGGAVSYDGRGALFAVITVAGPFDFGRPLIGAPGATGALLKIVP